MGECKGWRELWISLFKTVKNILRLKKTTGLHVKYLVFEVMYLSYLLVKLGPGAIFVIGFLNNSRVKNTAFFFCGFFLMILSVAEMYSIVDMWMNEWTWSICDSYRRENQSIQRKNFSIATLRSRAWLPQLQPHYALYQQLFLFLY